MRAKHLLIVICTGFILFSCQVNQQGENNLVIDVDDDFRLMFLENLSTPEDDLLFTLESIRNRECESDTVIMDLDHLPAAIAVNIDVVNGNSSCRPGISKILTQSSTDALLRDRMSLSIKLEELIANQGEILQDEETITIQMETTYGFYLPYEAMKKIPDNLVWGFVGYTGSTRPGAQEFIDRLSLLTTAPEVGDGQYGYFSLQDGGSLTVMEEQEVSITTQPFIRNFELGDTRQIDALFNEIKERYPALKMVLRDSYGKVMR